MTSRDRKRNRGYPATSSNAVRLGKRPVLLLDPRAVRKERSALFRRAKKRQAKQRAEVAEIVRHALRPAKNRNGDSDSHNSDDALERSKRNMATVQLLQDIRENMASKTDIAALRSEIHSLCKPPPAFAEPEYGRSDISLAELEHRLGAEAAAELFERIDKAQRDGALIRGRNIRKARAAFRRIQTERNVQVVVSGRSKKRSQPPTSDSDVFVILHLDDLEAVVKAAQKQFDWVAAFSPTKDLPAATSTPEL